MLYSLKKYTYSKICVKQPLSKRPKIGFQDQLSLNADQKYCRMHSAIFLTFIKLPFVIKVFVLSGHFTQVLLYTVCHKSDITKTLYFLDVYQSITSLGC